MNVLIAPTRRTRALVGLTTVALAAGAVLAPAAHAGTSGTPATIYGTTDATYDGVYRQSLAVLGLHAAGVTPPRSAVQWLLNQQCTNGGFTSFDADTSTRCTAADGIDSNATALAAQALIAVGKISAGQNAAALLQKSQKSDGGWEYTLGSGWGTDPNSAGLALTALKAAGRTPFVASTSVFASRQAGRTYLPDATTDAGAIAYTTTGDFAGVDVLATSQTIPGLTGLALTDVTPPAGWANDPVAYPTDPAANAAGIAGWATTWLAAKADAGTLGASNYAWSVLAFASNRTAKSQAKATYTKLRADALDFSTNPAALGQAALAATVLGEDEDADQFASLIKSTLQAAPKVGITTPGHRAKVSSWRTPRGTSSAAPGVKVVVVHLVEKRDGSWYSYDGKVWKKRVSLDKANAKAKRISVTPTANGAWSLKVKKLTKGKLKVHARAIDKAGGASTTSTTTVKLTKKK